MIRINITPAAFDAIAAMLVLGTVAVEPERAENGDIYVCRSSRPNEAQGAARSRRELQRRHSQAGEGRGWQSNDDPLTANKATALRTSGLMALRCVVRSGGAHGLGEVGMTIDSIERHSCARVEGGAGAEVCCFWRERCAGICPDTAARMMRDPIRTFRTMTVGERKRFWPLVEESFAGTRGISA
jgi:hypothetical protein